MASRVVITGAAGALGGAVVAAFVDRGWQVIAHDRPGPRLDALAGSDVLQVPVDLTDRSEVAAAWRQIGELGGTPPSALVTLAGGFVPGSLADTDEDALDMLFRTNLNATIWSCQAAAPLLTAAGGGAIVTVGSRTAVEGKAPVVHATSKAAVVRLTELLAEELRPAKIRANCVLPSVIDTPANRTWMSEDLASRAVPPKAIAAVIAFLCSDEAWPISGAAIPVYGDS